MFTTLFLLAPPREGRQVRYDMAQQGCEFLLAPPREGRRKENCMNTNTLYISTRAPTGGATWDGVALQAIDYDISTRAPTGGATPGPPCHRGGRYNFYSRPHGRGDLR